jgi:hypothetical protein
VKRIVLMHLVKANDEELREGDSIDGGKEFDQRRIYILGV